MFKVREISERYGVAEGTVLGWIASGQLAAINVGKEPGKVLPRWRITPAALEAFEAARGGAAPAAAKPARNRKQRGRAEVVEFYR
jgi:hypothetical protein